MFIVAGAYEWCAIELFSFIIMDPPDPVTHEELIVEHHISSASIRIKSNLITIPQGWMSCIYCGTSCRLSGRFSYEGRYCWGGWRKTGWLQVLDFKWCLEGLFMFQVPLHWRYRVELYPSQPRITLLGNVFIKLDTLITPCATFLFGFHAHSPFRWHYWRLYRSDWGMTLFIILLSPHRQLRALIMCCNWSKI